MAGVAFCLLALSLSLAPEWWREGPRGVAIRDYYEVEDTQGRRYWLFREGLYGGDNAPGWFVHGVFGI